MFEYLEPFIAQSTSFPTAAVIIIIGIIIAIVILVLRVGRESSSDGK